MWLACRRQTGRISRERTTRGTTRRTSPSSANSWYDHKPSNNDVASACCSVTQIGRLCYPRSARAWWCCAGQATVAGHRGRVRAVWDRRNDRRMYVSVNALPCSAIVCLFAFAASLVRRLFCYSPSSKRAVSLFAGTENQASRQ